MATIKQLPVSPRTKVFRAICAILQHDPVLSSVIKPENFRAWSGKGQDNMVFEYSNCPAIRITPANGPEQFQFPSAMVGALYLNVNMIIPGSDADDQLNLWWAIELALYPKSWAGAAANIATLQKAGANSGECFFSQPAFDPVPTDRFWAATGQIKIDVRLEIAG
jgi:hypothetical protein